MISAARSICVMELPVRLFAMSREPAGVHEVGGRYIDGFAGETPIHGEIEGGGKR